MREAIGRRAEALYGELDADQRDDVRRVFLAFVNVNEEREDTRRRVRRSELEQQGLRPDELDATARRVRAAPPADLRPRSGEPHPDRRGRPRGTAGALAAPARLDRRGTRRPADSPARRRLRGGLDRGRRRRQLPVRRRSPRSGRGVGGAHRRARHRRRAPVPRRQPDAGRPRRAQQAPAAAPARRRTGRRVDRDQLARRVRRGPAGGRRPPGTGRARSPAGQRCPPGDRRGPRAGRAPGDGGDDDHADAVARGGVRPADRHPVDARRAHRRRCRRRLVRRTPGRLARRRRRDRRERGRTGRSGGGRR